MVTQERLKELLDYNPDTGLFTWTNDAHWSVKGKRAGYLDKRRYVRFRLGRKSYLAHRIAWFYMNGEFPESHIDHINGHPDDNRIANLRKATNSENLSNQRISKSNTSGYKGVHWNKSSKKFFARIRKDGERLHLGSFDCPKEAHKAYCNAADKYHGEFANYG